MLEKCTDHSECSTVDPIAWIPKSKKNGCPSLTQKSKFYSREKNLIDFELNLAVDRTKERDQNNWFCAFQTSDDDTIGTILTYF